MLPIKGRGFINYGSGLYRKNGQEHENYYIV